MLELVDPRPRPDPRARRPVQRSEIKYADVGETLYNTRADQDTSVTPGTFGSNFYQSESGEIKYEMVRTATGVTVTVRIKFVDQTRDTRQTLPGGATNPNFQGYIGGESAIPAGDERRAFGIRMCGLVTDRWNGKLAFKSKESPAPGATEPDGSPAKPKDVRLPVTFRAVPIWDPAATNEHAKVRLYGSAVAAGGTGHPIDAGNYYMNMGDYVDADATARQIEDEQVATYAHEYGHLLGLDDEYSRSNFQAHQMLHKISPTLGGDRGHALDRATVERMIMAALTTPLTARLRSLGPSIARSFSSLRKPLQKGLTDAVAAGATNPIINIVLSTLLVPRTSPRLRRHIGTVVDFELGRNFSARQVARSLVGRALNANVLSNWIVNEYLDSLTAIQGEKTDVGGGPSGQFEIEIAGAAEGAGIWGAAKTGPLKATAGAIADRLVGPARGGRRVPAVAPSTSLLSQLEGIPAALETASAATGSMISEQAVGRRMLETIVTEALTNDAPITTMSRLYREGYNAVQWAAYNAARTELVGLLSGQLDPIVAANVDALRTSVHDEVLQVMATPAGAVAAAAPKDPEIAAMASAMKDRLAAQTPAGRTSTNPAGAGQPATEPAAGSQEIRYTTTGMMSDNSADVRPDQFERMVREFNDDMPALRHEREDRFTVDRGA
jgi:hypothetical protein